MHVVLLAYYSVLVVVASAVGGLIPDWIRLTHRRTELAVSFVAGTMLGAAMLHLLPHAFAAAGDSGATPAAYQATLYWALAGLLTMFFIERFFCFHPHVAEEESGQGLGPVCHHGDGHDPTVHGAPARERHPEPHAGGLTWSGAALGLFLHSLLAGVALAASVRHSPPEIRLAGLAPFLAIVLHKPLDSMTIAILMARDGWPAWTRTLVNALFALAVPTGVAVFNLGIAPLEATAGQTPLAAAMAFSAGVFLCVALSDLLPELHFHHHDRLKLTAALVAGLAVADLAGRFEAHSHAPAAPVTAPAEASPGPFSP